ncbi:periplasmic heavy metal sensor [Candidatus Accumulibacter phosphatis]|uniref:Periplasmic heavy metal sensor n=2 Tax=Candidatus Accumulibacter contiguus TaxID=2954381 RepID=A0ABX1T8A7_9PROT|nr:periplasmic heavy metal sensor [Candidatus Accumulibacter contiguus]
MKSFEMRGGAEWLHRERGRQACPSRSINPTFRSHSMQSKFTPRILVAALILALGAGGAAFAMSPERCGAPGGRMEHRMQYHMKEMSRLHDDLKLDARQDALWQDAEQFSRTSMREMGEQWRKHHEEVLASVSKPGADLRAVVKQMDELKDAGRKQREAGRDRWLAVYDSLDAAQKEKARLFFKSKIERMGQGGRFGPGGPGGPGGPARY